jgi:hypothetical protein
VLCLGQPKVTTYGRLIGNITKINTNPMYNFTHNPKLNSFLLEMSIFNDSKYSLEVRISGINISIYSLFVFATKKYKKMDTYKGTPIYLCTCTVSIINQPLRLYAWFSLPPPRRGHVKESRPFLANRVGVNSQQKYSLLPSPVQEYNSCITSLTRDAVLVTFIFFCMYNSIANYM